MIISNKTRQTLWEESTQITSSLRNIESIQHSLGGIFQNSVDLSDEDFDIFMDTIKNFEQVVDASTRELHSRLSAYVEKVNALREELKK